MRTRSTTPILAFLFAGMILFVPRLSERFLAQAPAPVTSAPWIEPDFPFFSSIVDARKAGPEFPADNLTPRGLVLRVGAETWAAFDVDLLRVSAIWHGKGVTPVALAPGSYHKPDRKTPGGQSVLPEPDGPVWLANGIYPGWQIGPQVSFTDPRDPAPSVEEVGRGPLPESIGRFTAIRHIAGGVVLEYEVGGAAIRERMEEMRESGTWTFARKFEVGPSSRALSLVLGVTSPDVSVHAREEIATSQPSGFPVENGSGKIGNSTVWTVRVLPHERPLHFVATFAHGLSAIKISRVDAARRRWTEEVTTT